MARTRKPNLKLPKWCACSRLCNNILTLLPNTTYYRHQRLQDKHNGRARAFSQPASPPIVEEVRYFGDEHDEISDDEYDPDGQQHDDNPDDYDNEYGDEHNNDGDTHMEDGTARDVPDHDALDLTIGELGEGLRGLLLNPEELNNPDAEEEDDTDAVSTCIVMCHFASAYSNYILG